MIAWFRKLIGRYLRGKVMVIPLGHYYHEMGHSLFCLIFEDSFIYERMHFDKETLLRVGDEKWEGAIHVKGIVEKKFEHPTAYFIKLIIIGFAGGCSENFLSYEFSEVDKYVENWIQHPDTQMNTTHMSGDVETIIKPSLKRCIPTDLVREFRVSVFRFIFSIINDEKVYRILSSMSHDLHSKQDEIVEGDVVRNLFKESGLSTYIEDMSTRIMENFHERFNKYVTQDDLLRYKLLIEAKQKGN